MNRFEELERYVNIGEADFIPLNTSPIEVIKILSKKCDHIVGGLKQGIIHGDYKITGTIDAFPYEKQFNLIDDWLDMLPESLAKAGFSGRHPVNSACGCQNPKEVIVGPDDGHRITPVGIRGIDENSNSDRR